MCTKGTLACRTWLCGSGQPCRVAALLEWPDGVADGVERGLRVRRAWLEGVAVDRDEPPGVACAGSDLTLGRLVTRERYGLIVGPVLGVLGDELGERLSHRLVCHWL